MQNVMCKCMLTTEETICDVKKSVLHDDALGCTLIFIMISLFVVQLWIPV